VANAIGHEITPWFVARRPIGRPVLSMNLESLRATAGMDSVIPVGSWSEASAPRATTNARHPPGVFVGRRMRASQLGRS